MLGNNVGAQVNALIADPDRMTGRDRPTARDQLLDLVAVRTAERALRHVAPVARAVDGEALRFLLSHPGAAFFLFGAISGHISHPISRAAARVALRQVADGKADSLPHAAAVTVTGREQFIRALGSVELGIVSLAHQ